MEYATSCPLELTKKALAKAPALLEDWRKRGRLNPAGKKSQGHGWHELPSNHFAGSHASSAAVKLIAHPKFPLPRAKRIEWVTAASLGVLKPFLAQEVDDSTPADDRERLLEAQRCTVKVSNFLSACAVLGADRLFKTIFAKLQPLAHSCVKTLLASRRQGGWGHWLDSEKPEIRRPFPTAAAFDALYRLAQVDPEVSAEVTPIVRDYAAETMAIFGSLLLQHANQPPAIELWRLLPALRTIALMDLRWLGASSSGLQPTRPDFERLFNAYLREELFGFGLNHTDDFQKYRLDQSASGTDYVAYNTTACLVRAIIDAVDSEKLHSSYAEWTAPHLCVWADQFCRDALPLPNRFSYIHQTLSCLLAAATLETRKPCIPPEIRMNIFPKVFSKRSFARRVQQGFYVTPFSFSTDWGMTKTSDELFTHFRKACEGFLSPVGRLSLVRGDHTPMGVITERIWQYINESEFLIALCVGANANVYYEIGVAHTLGKPVLLIGRNNSHVGAKGKATARSSTPTEADFKFDIAGVHHAEFDVDKFDIHYIEPVVTEFLETVYGR